MWQAVINLFGKIIPFIKEAIIAVTAYYMGKLQDENAKLEQENKAVKDAKEIDEIAGNTSTDDKRKRLRVLSRGKNINN